MAKYRRVAELGRGGMAIAYLAAMRGGGGVTKLVVVKELLPDLAMDPEFRSMFVDEARLAARLNHPNVVQTYEILEEDGQCGIVMEYLEGQPLSRIRAKMRGDDPDAFSLSQLAILSDLLAGLDYAHSLTDYDGTPLSIVHRDVSPHNLFVTYSGDTKILDFGIAKASDSSSRTRTGTLKGKLAYMAPEQARGERLDGRADLFSCGVILWEAAARRRMWKGLNDAAILHLLTRGEIPAPHDFLPSVPETLDAICRRATAPKPEDRFSSASEMARAIDGYLASFGRALPPRRSLGDSIASAFAEERQKLRLAIEENVGQVSSLSSDHFKALPPPPALPAFATEPPPQIAQEISGTASPSAHTVRPVLHRRRTNLIVFAAAAVVTAIGAIALLASMRQPRPRPAVALTVPASARPSAPTSAVQSSAVAIPPATIETPSAAASAKAASPPAVAKSPAATPVRSAVPHKPVPVVNAPPTLTTAKSSPIDDIGY